MFPPFLIVLTFVIGLLLLCLLLVNKRSRVNGGANMASQSYLQTASDKDRMVSAQTHDEDTRTQEDLRDEASSPWIPVHRAGQTSGTQHPLYRQISIKSGQVNSLTLNKVKEALNQLGLCSRGAEEVIRKRLKSHLKRELIQKDPTAPGDLLALTATNPYGLDYLLVLDFEATCLKENPPDYIHEIIEFPVLLLNLQTLSVDDEFHTYVKPVLNPVLSDFCKKLTGIRQDQVDSAPVFSDVFRKFSTWMDEKELGSKFKYAILTDCPWDIRDCLFPQCVLARVSFPTYATKWIDVRKLFASFYQMRSGNLSKMLQHLGLRFDGREHCGLDDTRNITKIILQLINDGCVLKYNRFMPDDVLRQFDTYHRR